MTSPTNRYLDLHPLDPDRALDNIITDLHDLYAAPLPPSTLYAAVRALDDATLNPRSTPHSTRRRAFGFISRRPRRLSLMLALVLVVLVGAGATFADLNIVQKALALLPGGTDPHYAVTLDQSRTACGFTVTLRRAYADENRLVIGYDVTTPAGRALRDASLPGLTAADARGVQLMQFNSTSTADNGLIAGNTRGNAQEFDTSTILQGVGRPLHLHLSAPAIVAGEIVTGSIPLTTPACEKDGPANRVGVNKPTRRVTVVGAFAFDIVVPFSPHVRMAAPHITGVSPRGTRVRLERIVVTPTEARLYVRLLGNSNAFFNVSEVDAGEARFSVASGTPIGGGLWVWRTFPGLQPGAQGHPWLYDDRGPWTVKVLIDNVDVQGKSHWGATAPLTVTVP